MKTCGIRVPGCIRCGCSSQRRYQSKRNRDTPSVKSGPRVPVLGIPAKSWQEMQPNPDLPTSTRPADAISVENASRCGNSVASTPSNAVNPAARDSTLGMP